MHLCSPKPCLPRGTPDYRAVNMYAHRKLSRFLPCSQGKDKDSDCIMVPAPVDDKAEPDRDVAEMPDAPELDLQDASPHMQEVLAEADALVAEVAGEVAGASKRYASPHFATCNLKSSMAAALGLTSWGVSADLCNGTFAHVWPLQAHVE